VGKHMFCCWWCCCGGAATASGVAVALEWAFLFEIFVANSQALLDVKEFVVVEERISGGLRNDEN